MVWFCPLSSTSRLRSSRGPEDCDCVFILLIKNPRPPRFLAVYKGLKIKSVFHCLLIKNNNKKRLALRWVTGFYFISLKLSLGVRSELILNWMVQFNWLQIISEQFSFASSLILFSFSRKWKIEIEIYN